MPDRTQRFAESVSLLLDLMRADGGSPLTCRTSAPHLFNAVGAVYITVLNLGVINSISVQPGLVAERFVFYREHRAGYYSALPWSVSSCITHSQNSIWRTQKL